MMVEEKIFGNPSLWYLLWFETLGFVFDGGR